MTLRLREWRDRRGLTYRDLGKRASVSIASVYRVENGQTSPTVAWLERVAKALRIDVHDLLPKRKRRQATRGTRR